MKSNIEIEGLERKIDQLTETVEMLQKRLVEIENFTLSLKKAKTRKQQERKLEDEMWVKS
jgi:prefoldin subunit 5